MCDYVCVWVDAEWHGPCVMKMMMNASLAMCRRIVEWKQNFFSKSRCRASKSITLQTGLPKNLIRIKQSLFMSVSVCVKENGLFFSSKYVVFEHVCVEQAFRFWLLYMYYGFSSLPFYLPEVLARTMNNVDYSIKSIYLWVRLIVSVRFSWGIGIWSAYSYLSYPPFDSTNTNGANGLCNEAILAHHKADFKFC